MLRILIFVFSFCFFSCNALKKSKTQELSKTSKYDSTRKTDVTSNNESSKTKDDKSEGQVKNKTEIKFTIDSSRAKMQIPIVNNYIPTGDKSADLLKWMIINGYLKSGSFENENDSVYRVVNSLIEINKEQKRAIDSMSSSKVNNENYFSEIVEKSKKIPAIYFVCGAAFLYTVFSLYKKYSSKIKDLLP